MREQQLKEMCMEIYLKNGEREFEYEYEKQWPKLVKAGLISERPPNITKLTPKALALIKGTTDET